MVNEDILIKRPHIYLCNLLGYDDISNICFSFIEYNNYIDLSKSDNEVSDFTSESLSEDILEDMELSRISIDNFPFKSNKGEILKPKLTRYNVKFEVVEVANISSVNETLSSKYPLYKTNTIIPIFEIKNSLFVGRIGIGTPPQYFWPIIDTGSSNLWIIGDNCNQPSCQKARRYLPFTSSTFRLFEPSRRLSVMFGTGKIYGRLAYEDIIFGNFKLKNQIFGMVEEEKNTESIDIFDTILFEGIIGLGFSHMSATPNLQPPLMERLEEEGVINQNIFAFYINDYRLKPLVSESDALSNPSALLLLGGVDERLYNKPLRMLPVVREHYWEVELVSLYIGDTKYCCDYGSLAYEWQKDQDEYLFKKYGLYEDLSMDYFVGNKTKDKKSMTGYVIFDSGTSLFTLPNYEYHYFIKKYPPFGDCSQLHLDGKKLSSKLYDYFPSITYEFINNTKIVITPEIYLIPDENGKCKPGFMQIDIPGEYGHAYILGSLFMRSYFTVYAKNIPNIGSAVGIAKAIHNKETRKYIFSRLASQNQTFVIPDDDEVEEYWIKRNGRLAETWKFEDILNFFE
ncbi:eukaryotic aspartyl protease family protein [Cryptosporidium muris RN66]|uniref:Eukaryotic aspartyl protease family protein n=1 Tax=Cryptosporidium muris (strain RN66) TaxID=441375 RepID=B6ABJ6_CRYMR|nr:eukaryotic aspartyl protease family protein [Cryptosporidium muris RN66]EEA05748.1 eukaryotic aspartyl protease family protein [Cryptosporidium muris RN66]|eukprot:XP_002140097.1 eukaryotic aspartyl protease family protein [Cryptosporidium muris RN66]